MLGRSILLAAILLNVTALSYAENKVRASLDWRQVAVKESLIDSAIWKHRFEIIDGIEGNIRYLSSEESELAYENFGHTPFSRDRVRQSLERFRALLILSDSPEELWQRLRKEFLFYRSGTPDGADAVRFTGYFQPIYNASDVRTEKYRFPIYSLPEDFDSWPLPHPTRVQLEGVDGTGGVLKGHELAWLSNRWEAFMIHVQGSALLRMTDGSDKAVGFAAGTQYKFYGISKAFLKENKIPWGGLPKFFTSHPEKLSEYLSKNNRFIFFRENPESKPMGSLGVPVIAERSIATDKQKLPPGALGLMRTKLPEPARNNSIKLVDSTRLVLDQDSGSAIKGPSRADVFMGTGEEAQRRANWLSSPGELYFLILKE